MDTQTRWTPANVISLLVVGFAITMLLTGLVALVNADLALLIVLSVLYGILFLVVAVVIRWLRSPQQVPVDAHGVPPLLVTRRGDAQTVINPGAMPGAALTVGVRGLDLQGDFQVSDLTAAAGAERVNRGLAALSQPGQPLEPRWGLAAKFLGSQQGAPPALPPVRRSELGMPRIRTLMLEGGEDEDTWTD